MTRRVTDNSHTNDPRPPSEIPGSYKKLFKGFGEPCGSCCISMVIRDINTYDKWKCPVTFPDNKEYVKYCIDYTGAYLRGVNELSGSLLSGWTGFSVLRDAAKKIGRIKGSKYIPLLSLNSIMLPEAKIGRAHV